MEVYTAYINPQETFCCSLKRVKETFREYDDVVISFGDFDKHYIPQAISHTINPKKWKGKMIFRAAMYEHKWEYKNGESICHKYVDIKEIYLCFYVIKKEVYTEEFKKEFETAILPKVKEWYLKYRGDRGYGTYEYLVEFHEGKFNTYENYCA